MGVRVFKIFSSIMLILSCVLNLVKLQFAYGSIQREVLSVISDIIVGSMGLLLLIKPELSTKCAGSKDTEMNTWIYRLLGLILVGSSFLGLLRVFQT